MTLRLSLKIMLLFGLFDEQIMVTVDCLNFFRHPLAIAITLLEVALPSGKGNDVTITIFKKERSD